MITLPAPRRKGNFFERRRAAAEFPQDTGRLAETGAAAELVEVDAPLEVRPVLPGERNAWRQDMARWHYLGDCNLVGESLRYVAMVGPGLRGRRSKLTKVDVSYWLTVMIM